MSRKITASAETGECIPKKKTIAHHDVDCQLNCKHCDPLSNKWSFKPHLDYQVQGNSHHVYNVIQTCQNIQFGGLKDGLLRDAYPVGIATVVNNDPTKPAISGIAMHMITRAAERGLSLFLEIQAEI